MMDNLGKEVDILFSVSKSIYNSISYFSLITTYSLTAKAIPLTACMHACL